jgi:hypothetical protein
MGNTEGSRREDGRRGEGIQEEVPICRYSIAEKDCLLLNLFDKVVRSNGLIIRLSLEGTTILITIKSGIDFLFPVSRIG